MGPLSDTRLKRGLKGDPSSERCEQLGRSQLFKSMAVEEEKTMAGVEALLSWAAQNGISDSYHPSLPPPPSSSSCLCHSLFVSDFPGAGGYFFRLYPHST